MVPGFATVILTIRTMAIWSNRWYIVYPLVLATIGHWVFLLKTPEFTTTWIPGQNCVITATKAGLTPYMFIYTMTLDFVILVLSAYKLFVLSRETQSRLVRIVFYDGVVYFILAFLANLLASIFMRFDLNPIMDVIANIPATVCSTVVACRLVRRLNAYAEKTITTESGTDGLTTTMELPTTRFSLERNKDGHVLH